MPTEKLTQILRSKGSFTESEIASMTEAEGWRWVYSRPKRTGSAPLQVCFTGFCLEEKAELAARASKAGLEVVRSVTKMLAILCTGSDPGPAKLEKAEGQGALVLDRAQFEHLIATGEIPKSQDAA